MSSHNTGQIVKICGITAEKAESAIKDLRKKHSDVDFEIVPKLGEVQIRLHAKTSKDKDPKKLIKPAVKGLKEVFAERLYTTDESVNLEQVVVELLTANNMSISTAESCTGGLLSSRIVSIPGASAIFKSGVITYSDKSKHKLLGVKNRTLAKYGAVSEECAKEMALGVAGLLKADVGVGITGIAGPDGGSSQKPVGLVYIAVSIGKDVKVKEYRFEGDRNEIRKRSATAALVQLRRRILEYYSNITFGNGKEK